MFWSRGGELNTFKTFRKYIFNVRNEKSFKKIIQDDINCNQQRFKTNFRINAITQNQLKTNFNSGRPVDC